MTVTAEDIINEVRKAAATRPDNVAECQYVLDGEPSCIVGVAMWNLGLIDEDIESDENLNCSTNVDYFLEDFGIKATVEQRRWLLWAQSAQDTGTRWQEAVDSADFHAPEAAA